MCGNIIEQYKEFLKGSSTIYPSYVCDSCKAFYVRPPYSYYCEKPECTGRIQEKEITWAERIKQINKIYPWQYFYSPIIYYDDFCKQHGYNRREFEENYLLVLEEYIKENILKGNTNEGIN